VSTRKTSPVAAGDGALALDPPDTAEGQLVVVEADRVRVGVGFVLHDGVAAVAGQPREAEIALRGHEPARAVVREAGRVGCGVAEQRSDRLLRLGVLAFAEVEVADFPAPVEQVLRRPVLVVPGAPRGEVVVERDRVPQSQLAHVLADVRLLPLERELG
jgi:hypothetical protein